MAGSSAAVWWPDGQALPRFAAPTGLDVVELSEASAPQVLLVMAWRTRMLLPMPRPANS